MTDRRRHLAQSRQFGALLQRLFRHGQGLPERVFARRFPAAACRSTGEALPTRSGKRTHPQRRASVQRIKGERQQDGKSHNFKRQNTVHTLAYTFVCGERDHAPTLKRDQAFQGASSPRPADRYPDGSEVQSAVARITPARSRFADPAAPEPRLRSARASAARSRG